VLWWALFEYPALYSWSKGLSRRRMLVLYLRASPWIGLTAAILLVLALLLIVPLELPLNHPDAFKDHWTATQVRGAGTFNNFGSERWLKALAALRESLTAAHHKTRISFRRDAYADFAKRLDDFRMQTLQESQRWARHYLPALDLWRAEAAKQLRAIEDEVRAAEPITANVYRPGSPLRAGSDADLFLGREDLRRALSREVRTARELPLLPIQGQRRVGKTSLLNFLPALLGPSFRVVRQDIQSGAVVSIIEQVVRPTGLVDPQVEVRPALTQVDDLLSEIRLRVERNERVLATTLTKRMAEDLTDYLGDHGVRVRYLHSDIDTVERVEIIRDLRLGEFDVLVGINLLREGLDMPEVSLVAVLDADKEGFLRSEGSLIQTIGRAARNANGKAILYADEVTGSMRRAIDETERRRDKQIAHNEAHGITPRTIQKAIADIMETHTPGAPMPARDYARVADDIAEYAGLTPAQMAKKLKALEKDMYRAAKDLEFEKAAQLRDRIRELRGRGLAA